MPALSDDCLQMVLRQLLPCGNPTTHPKYFEKGFLDAWLKNTLDAISHLQRICIQCVCRKFAKWKRLRGQRFSFLRLAPRENSENRTWDHRTLIENNWRMQTWIVYSFGFDGHGSCIYFEELAPFVPCEVDSQLYNALLDTQLQRTLPCQRESTTFPRNRVELVDVTDAMQPPGTGLREKLAYVIAHSSSVQLCRKTRNQVAIFPTTYRYTCRMYRAHDDVRYHYYILGFAHSVLRVRHELRFLDRQVRTLGWDADATSGYRMLCKDVCEMLPALLKAVEHEIPSIADIDSLNPRCARAVVTNVIAECDDTFRYPPGLVERQIDSREMRLTRIGFA